MRLFGRLKHPITSHAVVRLRDKEVEVIRISVKSRHGALNRPEISSLRPKVSDTFVSAPPPTLSKPKVPRSP